MSDAQLRVFLIELLEILESADTIDEAKAKAREFIYAQLPKKTKK